MIHVDFQPVGRRVELAPGKTLLEAAQAAGIELTAVCGGIGTCGDCRIRLARGNLSAPTLAEQATLTPGEIASGQRLACQAIPQSDCVIDIPPESLTAPQRLQVEDELGVSRIKCQVSRGTWHVAHDTPFGLAIDIGTTKLAAFLVNLTTGQTLGRVGAMNPQIGFGEDVIARIQYANTHPDGRTTLQSRLAETLNGMAAELCQQAGILSEQIGEVVAVGNTVMHHLFAGLPVQQLGVAPYSPAVVEAMTIPARQVGLALAPDATVYLPPNIAGYVGADHVAAILAVSGQRSAFSSQRSAINRQPPTVNRQPSPVTLLLDIGTNTEVSLSANGRILSCSCASGPAFEGAHIRDGMRAAPGAIERVQIRDGAVRVHTIGNQPPVGICGSGILDAVAELLSAGVLDWRGNFTAGQPQATLVLAAQTGHGRDILVTRKDVNEIQLAKGAIRAGVDVLLAEAGLPSEAIDEFIVAGAFGTYLDIGSAIRVGMFPDLPRERFRQVGNAAGAGARQMLLDPAARQFAEKLARRVEYVELSSHPAFREAFVKNILFDRGR